MKVRSSLQKSVNLPSDLMNQAIISHLSQALQKERCCDTKFARNPSQGWVAHSLMIGNGKSDLEHPKLILTSPVCWFWELQHVTYVYVEVSLISTRKRYHSIGKSITSWLQFPDPRKLRNKQLMPNPPNAVWEQHMLCRPLPHTFVWPPGPEMMPLPMDNLISGSFIL